MAKCETVEVQAPGGGTMVINASDFDESKHKKAGAAKAPAKKAKKPAKKAKKPAK